MFGTIYIDFLKKLFVPFRGISAALSGPCGCFGKQKQGDILGMPVKVTNNSAGLVLGGTELLSVVHFPVRLFCHSREIFTLKQQSSSSKLG